MTHLHNRGAAAREKLKNAQLAARNHSYEIGMDPQYLSDWKWPQQKGLLERNKERLEKLSLGS